MRFRFLEAESESKEGVKLNHGKFAIFRFDVVDASYISMISERPLLFSLPPTRRFGGDWKLSTIILFDLQTQEGMAFDPYQPVDVTTRRFLVHPLHVCLLYYPVLMHIVENADKLWTLPRLITFSTETVLQQPGVLIDMCGEPVVGRFEWSKRHALAEPMAARLRNPGDIVDYEDVFTEEEKAESALSKRPVW